ncbi:MAG: hypoxanthine phosphoribosyltransferase [Planctomycetota bacterium]|jgi:hypoxanthine phosphoribosyltransferase
MATITVKDKQFRPYLSVEEIDEAVTKVAKQINEEFNGQKVLFIAILNGSFMFASDLLKKIDLECEISFVKIASYSGTKSTGKVKKLIGLMQSLEDRNVIIVEDIIDTGNTLDKLLPTLIAENPKSLKLCSLLFKPEAFKADFDIHYIGKEIPNKFILGYGLDYDELGRNLKEIYQIVE